MRCPTEDDHHHVGLMTLKELQLTCYRQLRIEMIGEGLIFRREGLGDFEVPIIGDYCYLFKNLPRKG